jgi:hypothetical protein
VALNLGPAKRTVEKLLTDDLKLVRDRPGVEDDTLDLDTGALVPPAEDEETLWEGLGAVLADREDGTYRVLLPMEAPLSEVGDHIDILSSVRDAQLVGKRVRVRNEPRGGTFAIVRIIHAELEKKTS